MTLEDLRRKLGVFKLLTYTGAWFCAEKTKEAKMERGQAKSLLIVVCIILALMLAGGFFSMARAAEKAKTLKIGYLLAATGWYSVFDAAEERDIKSVARMINDKGGIIVKGEKYMIELVGEDMKSTIEGATAAANKLAFEKGVKFVVGPGAFFTLGAAPVLGRAKVLEVSGWNTMHPGEMDATTPYVFLGFSGNPGMVLAQAKAMQAEFPAVKKVVIVTPDEGWEQSGKIDTNLLRGEGFTVLDIIRFPNEMVDCSPVVAKINSLKEAEGIIHISGPPQLMAYIVKGLRQMGDTRPYAALLSSDDVLHVTTLQDAENMIMVGFKAGAPNNTPLMKEVFERGGKKGPMFLMSPNALYVLTEMIKAANSIDPAAVKAKWESMDRVDTLFGPGTICGDKTYGIKHHAVGHPLAYEVIKGGKLSSVKWVPAPVIP
jgi:ABC-type branched-subunit amino acid transport system substrate-binding protein